MTDSRTPDDAIAGPQPPEKAPRPTATEIRAALERILTSRGFQQAGRASDFLRFVVEQTLAGAGQRLKGYTIGVEVFGRPADFDAQSDALVRVEAGRLRRRLVEYYAGEGASDPVRIELPRGSYAVDCRFARPDEHGEPLAAAPPPPEPARRSLSWRHATLGLTVLLFAAIGVIASQQRALQQEGRATVRMESARSEWPRIVVVPFENLSRDESLGILAASMTEEVMLRLYELDLSVVASQGGWYEPNGGIERVASGSAGDYVLTGSVRGTAANARITVRLIEASSGAQLWAAAYDEPLVIEQLPALQEIVGRDVAAMAAPYGPMFEAELSHARRATGPPKLRDCLVTYHEYRRRMAPGAFDDAVACFQSVGARQPEVAAVWSGLGMLYIDEYVSTFGRAGAEMLQAARTATETALALDRNDFLANLALTRVQFFSGDPAFRDSISRMLELRPRSAQALANGGFLLALSGDSARGLALAEQAREASKSAHGPSSLYHLAYAVVYMRDRRFTEALASAQKINGQSWIGAQAIIAAAAAHSGRREIAARAVERLRQLYPEFEAEALASFAHWNLDDAYYEALVTGLREAGLEFDDGPARLSGG